MLKTAGLFRQECREAARHMHEVECEEDFATERDGDGDSLLAAQSDGGLGEGDGASSLDVERRLGVLRRAGKAAPWLLFFALGFGAAALLESRLGLGAPPPPGLDAEDAPSQDWLSTAEWSRGKDKPWAYVMMAYDPPGEPMGSHLWGAVAMARSLHQFTGHRIVLLTNHREFPDGTPVKESFLKLGVEVRAVHRVYLPEHGHLSRQEQASFWKLQAWAMHDLERVVWLDTDALVYRNMDWLLDDREGMWAARAETDCKLQEDVVHTGIMALKPNAADFHGLMTHATKSPHMSVHEVIATFFKQHDQEIQLLSDLEAGFGRCLGAPVESPYVSEDGKKTNGLWSVPSFIHKSGGYGGADDVDNNNICFAINLHSQRYFVGKAVINVCQFHPLGAQWRALFCEGARDFLGLEGTEIQTFCADHCYFWGEGAHCGGKVDGTPDYGEYYARIKGLPGTEVELSKQ